MCPKLMITSRDWSRLRQEHPFMRVHKYGGTNHMEANQIFGRLVAFSMKCAALSLLSTAKISMTSTKVCREATTTLYQKFTLENYSKSSPCASSKGQKTDQLHKSFFDQMALFFPNATITKYTSRKKKAAVKISFYQLSRCQQI